MRGQRIIANSSSAGREAESGESGAMGGPWGTTAPKLSLTAQGGAGDCSEAQVGGWNKGGLHCARWANDFVRRGNCQRRIRSAVVVNSEGLDGPCGPG